MINRGTLFDRSVFSLSTPVGKVSFAALFLPILFENASTMILSTVNTAVISGFSENAAAAIGTCVPIITMFLLVQNVISMGAGVIISNRIGGGELRSARQTAYSGAAVGILCSVLLTWTVVAMHNPMYSVGKYGSDPNRNTVCLSLRRQLQEIFYDYEVDLVLQGHDHAISRTYPINGDGDVIKEDWTNVDGTKYSVDPTGVIYLMNGPAGPQSRAPYGSYDASKYEYAQTSHSRSWAEITVEDNVLTVTVRYYNGVYQTWGIIKNQ